MIDREALVPAERPIVAAVIWNRLRMDMLLQIDATIQYALGKTKPVLTYDDLKIDSPYNTYKHAGSAADADLQPRPGGAAGGREPDGRRVPLLRGAQRRHRAALLLRRRTSSSSSTRRRPRPTATERRRGPRPARRRSPAARGQCSSTPAARPRRRRGQHGQRHHTRHRHHRRPRVALALARLHNAAFAALGLDYVYVPLPVRAAEVGAAVRGLAALGFRGANVTIPHKGAVIPYLDELVRRRRLAEAVNTIVVDEGAPARLQHRRGRRPRSAGRRAPAIRCAAPGAGPRRRRGGARRRARSRAARVPPHRRESHARRGGAPGGAHHGGRPRRLLRLARVVCSDGARGGRVSASWSTRPRSGWPARVKSLPSSPITLRRGKSYSMRYTRPRRPTSSWRRGRVGPPSSTV